MKFETKERGVLIFLFGGESNFSVGEVAETPPSFSCLFRRSLQAGLCSDDPMAQKILETIISAVCGKCLAGNLKGDT